MRSILLRVAFCAAFALSAIEAAAADELSGTLKKIKDSGTISIGYNERSVPFSYIDDKGQPVGYTIDLCMAIVAGVKHELKLERLEINYVMMTGATMIPLLVNGTVDMVCTITTMSLSRRRQVDFLSITYIAGNQIVVKKTSGIREVEDLKGKRVAVTQGSQNEKNIKEYDAKLKLGIQFLATEDQPRGWLALESDRVDAYMTDSIIGHGLIHVAAHPEQFEVVGRLLSYDPYSVVIRNDDAAFKLIGVRTLAELFRSGEINTIYDKWLAPIAGPPSEMLKTVWAAQAFPP